jgi:hypothetical protein
VGSDNFTLDFLVSNSDNFSLSVSVLDNDLIFSGFDLNISQLFASRLLEGDLEISNQRMLSDLEKVGEFVEFFDLDGLLASIDGMDSVNNLGMVTNVGSGGGT